MPVRKNTSGNWFIDRYVDGRRIRMVIPEARTRAQALAAETAFVEDLYKRKYAPEAKRKLFSDYVRDSFLPYSRTHKKTYYDDVRICAILGAFFKGKHLDEITPAMIEDYKRHRLAVPKRDGKPRSAARVNREFNTLSKILSLAVNDDLLAVNPCRKVKRLRTSDARTRYLTADEERRLMAELKDNPRTRRFVTIALYTGMRRGEIANLAWDNVDADKRIIHVKNTKSGEARSIPMSETVLAVFDELKREAALLSGPVFVRTKKSERSKIRPSEENCVDVERSFVSALRRAGIQNFRFHDLRHSAGTRLADAGVNIVAIAEVLGHKDLRTTKRYLHATDTAKREAMERLSRHFRPEGD
jgi:integrase